MKEKREGNYFLIVVIVAIVAIAGIVLLVSYANQSGTVSSDSTDVVGQAYTFNGDTKSFVTVSEKNALLSNKAISDSYYELLKENEDAADTFLFVLDSIKKCDSITKTTSRDSYSQNDINAAINGCSKLEKREKQALISMFDSVLVHSGVTDPEVNLNSMDLPGVVELVECTCCVGVPNWYCCGGCASSVLDFVGGIFK